VSHLASYEAWNAELLAGALGGRANTYQQLRAKHGSEFNQAEVDKRKPHSVDQVLAEYANHLQQVMELAGRMPDEVFRQVGTIGWYGPEYCLNDFLVYTNYGHKREHAAQFSMWKDRLAHAGLGGRGRDGQLGDHEP